MKPKHIRAFKVRDQRFHLTDRGDGTLVVTSIHPYDEIEYNWALQASKSRWHIYRCGKIVATVFEHKEEITPEQIAFCLMRADLEAGLISWNAVWGHRRT